MEHFSDRYWILEYDMHCWIDNLIIQCIETKNGGRCQILSKSKVEDTQESWRKLTPSPIGMIRRKVSGFPVSYLFYLQFEQD